MQLGIQFSAIATREKVDAQNGVIYGVSVITLGEAKGHNLWVDHKTLQEVVSLGNANPDGVRVKLRHSKKNEDNPVVSITGSLRSFRIDGERVRADFHLLKSDDAYAKILEMAEKQPRDFGLSLSCNAAKEEIDGKDYIRLSALDSVDLTEDPAANPTGLFSINTINQSNMSKAIALALSLPETATEEQIAEALKTQLAANKPADLTKLTAEIEAAKTQLSQLQTASVEAAKAAKTAEIAALVAEASRDGKVVPLTDVQLAAMDVAVIKEMISKLPKAQVALSRKPAAPTDKDGKEITTEHKDRIEFCRSKKAEGAEALTALIRGQLNHN